MKKLPALKWTAVGVLVLLVLLFVFLHSSKTTAGAHHGNDDSVSAVVHATNDEELRFLTAKINELTEQNKTVLADNKLLQSRIQQSSNMQLSESEQKLEQQLHQQAQAINNLKVQVQQAAATSSYPVQTSMSVSNSDRQTPAVVTDQSLLNIQKEIAKKPKDIPYFTIPANATLADVVLESDILAEVPKSNTLLQPAFHFKAILGNRDLLASNSITLPPDLNGIVFEGFSIGTMPPMSCARGYITKMLFTWKNGYFTVVGKDASDTELNPTDTLGYISSPYGNPCLPGQFITDANEVLPNLALLGGLTNGGMAVANAQQSIAQNGFSGETSSITGSVTKYMAASTIAGGSKAVQDWYMSRVNSTFDVVYIPASSSNKPTPIVVNITRDIPIDKHLKSRRINYENHNKNAVAEIELD